MRLKRTVWVPLAGGLILGALSFLITVADITVQISDDLILGPWEIINTLSAAFFGPLGLLVTELGLDASGYLYYIRGVFPAPQDFLFMVGNYGAHVTAMMITAMGYRAIYRRWKMPGMLGGWLLLLVVYYLVGVTLQVTAFNLAVPGLNASYAVYFETVRLEFVLVAVVTSLALVALPERYRRPHWTAPEREALPGAE